MSITTTQIKELRELTGAGILECKQALVSTDGNIEAAVELMRKAGQAKAAKKVSRIAAEGVISIKKANDAKSAFMVEINTETDFVARDSTFLQFVNTVSEIGLMHKVSDLPALLDAPVSDTGKTIIESLQELISKLGENIKIRRLAYVQNEGIVGTYCHNNRIGVLVELAKYDTELGKDIAMHVAASKPQVITPEQLPAALIAKEKEIYLAQFAESGKPAAIIEKMVVGKMQKFINEVSLIKQPYIKDDTITIGDLLKKHNNNVLNFVRFEVGEGIEKETKDFAEEVMSQLQKKNK